MDSKQRDELTHDLEKQLEPLAQEIADTAAKKLEPVTRIITLASMVGALIFLIVFIIQGHEGSMNLLFIPILWSNTGEFISIAILMGITLWYLVSTIRFFIRRTKNKTEAN